MAALAGPFNTGWYYYQPVLKGGALAPVARTGTKGWAFGPGRTAPAREPGQQTLPDRWLYQPMAVGGRMLWELHVGVHDDGSVGFLYCQCQDVG